MEKQTNKLTGKDLINVGIYTAMTIVVFFAFGLLTTIPVMYPILLFVLPFVCGIPMMLYYTKIKKFGMLTITGLICGIFFFFIGYTWLAIVFWTAGGLAADLVLRIGKYQGGKIAILSYGVFCLGMIGWPAPLWLAGEAYWDNIRTSMGAQFANTLQSLMPSWMGFVALAVLFIGGICGALVGRKMLKKHFQRAGIV